MCFGAFKTQKKKKGQDIKEEKETAVFSLLDMAVAFAITRGGFVGCWGLLLGVALVKNGHSACIHITQIQT